MIGPLSDTPLILYDGVCNLCTGTVLFVIRRDPRRRFKFASMQSPLGQRLLKEADLPLSPLKTFVLVEEGGFYTRSTAALRVARGLKRPWPLLSLLVAVPRPIRDAVYDLVVRNRYRLFGKRESCMVPTPEIRDRFLEWV
jgi:predicted DCC family thiol-disulfide oxidoreductase YuxK